LKILLKIVAYAEKYTVNEKMTLDLNAFVSRTTMVLERPSVCSSIFRQKEVEMSVAMVLSYVDLSFLHHRRGLKRNDEHARTN